jgi:hypothetical protein
MNRTMLCFYIICCNTSAPNAITVEELCVIGEDQPYHNGIGITLQPLSKVH